MTCATTSLLGALVGGIRPVLHKALNFQELAAREKNPSGQSIGNWNYPV
jgi:hypothetical protein